MPLRLKQFSVVITALSLGLFLAGCVAFGGVDGTTSTIDKSVGTARNNSILLNIVRASLKEPLYFYSVSHVGGSALEDLKISLPAITLGPGKILSQKNYTFGLNGLSALDSQRSGNFDFGVLDGKNFYQGMLEPLDLAEVNILLKQGFPRELVYRIAVADVTVYDGQLHRYINDPRSPTYAAFNAYFGAAMTHGITTEAYLPPDAAPADGDAAKDGKKKDDGGLRRGGVRLCYDPALVAAGQAQEDVVKSGNECGERPATTVKTAGGMADGLKETYEACTNTAGAQPSTRKSQDRVCAHLGGKVFAVQLNTRSLFGIFGYLGAALAERGDIELVGLGSDVEPRVSGPLMTINTTGGKECFAYTEWRGNYCIPLKGSENLKTTFSMINALQALKTTPGDLPVTTAVRIEQ